MSMVSDFDRMCAICHSMHTNVETWTVKKVYTHKYCNDCFLIAHKNFFSITTVPWQVLQCKTTNQNVLKLCIQHWEEYNEDGLKPSDDAEESGSIVPSDVPVDYVSGPSLRNAFGNPDVIAQNYSKKKKKGG